jgi:hypothetical protein
MLACQLKTDHRGRGGREEGEREEREGEREEREGERERG